MSISRGLGRSEISAAIVSSSSVVLPRAESTATTLLPRLRSATIRPAARFRSSGPATEVPPNFITTVSLPEPTPGVLACVSAFVRRSRHGGSG